MILSEYHSPVLLPEILELLNIRPGSQYLDATLGGAGYSLAIVKLGGRVLSIDIDPDAVKFSRQLASKENVPSGKWLIVKDSFANLGKTANKYGFSRIKGIIFDLGLSSHQLDESGRGFSFRHEGEPLDMRFSPETGLTAAYIINNYTKEKLYEIFSKYAEELAYRSVADIIFRARALKGEITTVGQLNRIIEQAVGKDKKYRQNALARIYQALRIETNNELSTVEKGIREAIRLLTGGGRLLVLSFHSLEDRLIKGIFRENAKSGRLKILIKNPLRPQYAEIRDNPRSKSAKLRAAEKI